MWRQILALVLLLALRLKFGDIALFVIRREGGGFSVIVYSFCPFSLSKQNSFL